MRFALHSALAFAIAFAFAQSAVAQYPSPNYQYPNSGQRYSLPNQGQSAQYGYQYPSTSVAASQNNINPVGYQPAGNYGFNAQEELQNPGANLPLNPTPPQPMQTQPMQGPAPFQPQPEMNHYGPTPAAQGHYHDHVHTGDNCPTCNSGMHSAPVTSNWPGTPCVACGSSPCMCGGQGGGFAGGFGNGFARNAFGGNYFAGPQVGIGAGGLRNGGWFGGAGVLFFQRDYESDVPLSYMPAMPREDVLTSNSADLQSMVGVEASIGRCMNNGWAWQLTYWNIFQDSAMASASGMPDTRLRDLQYISYTPAGYAGDTVYNWFNNAADHRVRRENEFHNIELSFFRGGLNSGIGTGLAYGGGCGSPACGSGSCGCGAPAANCWDFNWMVGPRFFKFDEFFQYAASVPGGFTYMEPREIFYDVETENNLIGVQLGGTANRSFGRCWSLFAGTKFGIYNNRIQHYSRIYGPSGDAMVNTGSYNGSAFSVRSTKDDLAVLGEMNVGVRYQFSKCWRATIGYRAMAATGIALAPDQMTKSLEYLPAVQRIDSDGSLLLHGGFAGLEFRR